MHLYTYSFYPSWEEVNVQVVAINWSVADGVLFTGTAMNIILHWMGVAKARPSNIAKFIRNGRNKKIKPLKLDKNVESGIYSTFEL